MSLNDLFAKLVKATLEGFAACAPYPLVDIPAAPKESAQAPQLTDAPASKPAGPCGP